MDLAPTGDLLVDTAVTSTSPGCYATIIRDGYGAGAGVPNGGLLLAIMARAMADTAQRPALLTVTAQYLRRSRPGPATVATETLRSGRMVMTRARLEQAGDVAIHASGIFADRAVLPRRTHVDMTPPDLPDPDTCLALDDLPDAVVRGFPPIFHRLDHRIPSEQLRFVHGTMDAHASVAGWYRPLVGRADEIAVPFLMDALFPPVFNIGMRAFVPTLEFTVQVRRPPGDDWLRYRFATRAIAGGVMEEDGQLWTAGGELIALSRQTALPSD